MNNAAYKNFAREFSEVCQRFGGTPNSKDAIGEGLSFDIPTPLGVLKASIHCDANDNRRGRGYYIESIFLRFKTFSTGKVYDFLLGHDFNGYSGKWNIMTSGDDLASIRLLALSNLEHRLEKLSAHNPI